MMWSFLAILLSQEVLMMATGFTVVLATARLKWIGESMWSQRYYLDVEAES